MATKQKHIKKRWMVTRYNFDPKTQEVESVDVYRPKELMTERTMRARMHADILGHPSCFMIQRAYK